MFLQFFVDLLENVYFRLDALLEVFIDVILIVFLSQYNLFNGDKFPWFLGVLVEVHTFKDCAVLAFSKIELRIGYIVAIDIHNFAALLILDSTV